MDAQTAPKEVIRTLSEDLLSRFKEAPLLNRYDLYQQLMDYWAEVMQDDVYLVVAEGWQQAAQPRPIIKDKMRKIEENADLTVNKQKFKMDLIPPELIINRYFSEEQKKLDELALQWETATQKRSDFEEEHQNEEGALSGLEGKNGISKGNVQNRVMKIKQTILEKYPKDSEEYQLAKTIKKTIFGQNQWPKGQKDEDGLFEELDVLYDYLQLQEEESTLKKQYNQEQKKLNQAVLAKYGNLSDEAIKTLVVEDKWLTDIRKAIEEEVNRLTQQLAGRIRELEERYAEPLPDIEEEVKDYSSKVQEHLKNMGVQ